MRRTLSRIAGERGSAAASAIFTMFTALTLTAVTAAVISSMALTAATGNHTAANSATQIVQERHLASLAHDTAAPGEVCTGLFCSHIATSIDSGGLRVLTIEGSGTAGSTETRTLRPVSGTMISGFDSTGAPVWTDQKDLTPYRFGTLMAGTSHTCAIDAAKAAWCWGDNDEGQLGDGSTSARSAPVKVQASALFASLAPGGTDTSCGLTEGGTALCWGSNDHGQLGTGDTEVGKHATTPASPAGDHTFTSLVQSATTTCGIDDAKKTWCWGANPGNGAATGSATPVEVAGPHEFTALSLGAATACGIDTSGKAWCWASTPAGSTGVDPAPAPGTPAEVAGGRVYATVHVAPRTDLASPSSVCAIDSSSAAWCWGHNAAGQLGNGSTTGSPVPVAVTGGHHFSTLAMAGTSVCGVSDTARLWCWGENTHGQIGEGSTTDAKNPASIDSGEAYKSVRAGTGFFCAVTASGQAKCWGVNTDGQAAPGSVADVKAPAAVPGLGTLKTVTADASHVCGVDARAEVICWGRNDQGQTGSGTPSATAPPGHGVRKEISPSPFAGFLKGGK
jgi:alpha-tubulin suppressor-like RCC1 family protein